MPIRRPPAERPLHSDLLVEFCVLGIAVTMHSKKPAALRAWKAKVGIRAQAAARASGLIDGAVELHITEFSERQTKDRDNLAKPIQDALQGILFRNDRQVSRLDVDWRDINGLYRVRYMSRAVASALSGGREFVWLRVYRSRPRENLLS